MSSSDHQESRVPSPKGLFLYWMLACAITWSFAMPAALAWMRSSSPSPGAVACAGISAFGPLIAAWIVAARERTLGEVFGRYRTRAHWVLLALFAPMAIHLAATLLFVLFGGTPNAWFHPPATKEQWAALFVLSLGEEFGWRGFAHPRVVERFGMTRGSLLLGAAWGFWHLAYSITPQAAGFDPQLFALTMIQLPLYSVLIAWVFERSGRSMAVALAFHAGGHLDHFELATHATLELHALHVLVLAILATIAARSFSASRSADLDLRGDRVAPGIARFDRDDV